MSRYDEMNAKATEVARMLESHFSGHVGVLLMKVLGDYWCRPPDDIDWRSKEGRAYRKAEKALMDACDDFTRARLNLPWPSRKPAN